MLIKSQTKVDKLTKRVENLYEQKEIQERLDEQQKARLKEIKAAQDITKTDFWCGHHRRDFTALAYKVAYRSFGDWCAYYEAFTNGFPKEMVACCKGLRRYITDKNSDPYYFESEMIVKQRKEAIANGDLLQPGQEGFITKYGDPNKKLYEKLEKEARASWTKKIIV